MWKWSRIKLIVTSRISNALLLMFLAGTVLNIDNLVAKVGLDVLTPNLLLLTVSDYLLVPTVGLLYTSSVCQFVAYIIYATSSPRNIEISISRFDYVSRSLGSINSNNVLRWMAEINRERECGEVFYDPEQDKKIKRIFEYFTAQDSVSPESIDVKISDDMTSILQSKYEYLNGSKPVRRLFATSLIFLSIALAFISTLDSIIRNFTMIIG